MHVHIRTDFLGLEEFDDLVWDFAEDFPRESGLIILKFIEWNKLNNVTTHEFTGCFWVKWLVIRVENVHVIEISVANSNNDNGQWQLRRRYNLIDGLLHVHDDAVGQDQ